MLSLFIRSILLRCAYFYGSMLLYWIAVGCIGTKSQHSLKEKRHFFIKREVKGADFNSAHFRLRKQREQKNTLNIGRYFVREVLFTIFPLEIKLTTSFFCSIVSFEDSQP